jgi:hypothetical protein
MNGLIKRPTHYVATGYHKGDCIALERYFSVWNRTCFRYDPVAYIYDEEAEALMVPGGTSPYMLEKFTGFKIQTNYECDTYDTISIRQTTPPRNELQTKMVHFLIGEGDYTENRMCSQLACNAETGEGKTFAAISAMTYFRCKMIVIVNRKSIKKTWIDECQKFSDIDPARILDVKTDTIRGILDGDIDPSNYWLFVTIHRSIQSVASDVGWHAITEFFEKLRVGLKVYDEANMEFTNSVKIDAYTNTYKTLYLTANMERSGISENSIFQRAFSKVNKFDQYALGYNTSKKHIHFIAILYNSSPTIRDISIIKKGGHGFNGKSYSEYQVSKDGKFFEIIFGLLDKFAIKNNFRTLVLTAKINSCTTIKNELVKQYPKKKIGVYNSSVEDKEKARVLEEDEIIVSTTQSLGFSQTISNLRCVINCEAFRFKATGNQASGRLRRLPNGEQCFYVELVDTGFYSIREQYTDRLTYYKKLFSEIVELKY